MTFAQKGTFNRKGRKVGGSGGIIVRIKSVKIWRNI